MDKLPDDIVQRVKKDFHGDDADAVMRQLEAHVGPERDRVLRCVLHLSRGDTEEIRINLETAAVDYSDIIHFAEYDRQDNRVHDFSTSFD